jgi:hypothetical protein
MATSTVNELDHVWEHSYRHWVFVPKEREQDNTRTTDLTGGPTRT